MKTFLTLSLALAIHSLAVAQNIPDSIFAQAIRNTCPACIDANDNLTANADTLTYLDVSSTQIRDLSGVVGFDNLQTLWADYTPIDSFPALPASLRQLNAFVSNLHNIDNVSNLPNLEILNVSYAQLTALPSLPNSIKRLTAYGNNISQVQNWPTQLYFLDISYNRLTNLAPLGDSITYLNVSFNQFDSLNIIGADNLKTLWAFNNSIEYIQRLPDQLEHLNVEDNLLTTLPPLPFSLEVIKASYNQIDTISRLNHIRGLKRLELIGNHLSTLPLLPDNLEELYVSANDLSTFPPLPSVLRTLYFGNNQISQWPSLGDSIRVIAAYYNQISNVDFLPPNLEVLYIDDNPQLNCLPTIPYYLYTLSTINTNINCLPNARQIQLTLLGLPVCDSANNTNNCLMLSVDNTPTPTFLVSPNPFQNYLTVQNSNLLDDNSQLFLYNHLGQLVAQQQLNSDREIIDLNHLQPAVYYLMVKTEKGSFSQKIIKK